MVVPGMPFPLQPNVLQLHRATQDPNWPLSDLDGELLPPPMMYGKPGFGSRLLIREMTHLLMDEIPRAFADAAALRALHLSSSSFLVMQELERSIRKASGHSRALRMR